MFREDVVYMNLVINYISERFEWVGEQLVGNVGVKSVLVVDDWIYVCCCCCYWCDFFVGRCNQGKGWCRNFFLVWEIYQVFGSVVFCFGLCGYW